MADLMKDTVKVLRALAKNGGTITILNSVAESSARYKNGDHSLRVLSGADEFEFAMAHGWLEEISVSKYELEYVITAAGHEILKEQESRRSKNRTN